MEWLLAVGRLGEAELEEGYIIRHSMVCDAVVTKGESVERVVLSMGFSLHSSRIYILGFFEGWWCRRRLHEQRHAL